MATISSDESFTRTLALRTFITMPRRLCTIASTLRASTIAQPFYGYDPQTGDETGPFEQGAVTVMAVDNLPGELPRDAATDFGEALIRHVLPEVLGQRDSGMLARASITADGRLTPPYAYLKNYLEGRS